MMSFIIKYAKPSRSRRVFTGIHEWNPIKKRFATEQKIQILHVLQAQGEGSVTSKENFAAGKVLYDYSVLVTLYEIGAKTSFTSLPPMTLGKRREWKICCSGIALSSEPGIYHFRTSPLGRLRQWTALNDCCTCSLCETRIVFLIQIIISLICGVDVAVP